MRNYLRLTALLASAVFTLVLALPRISQAAEFYAMVEPGGRKPFASMDFGLDTRAGAGVNVEFRAYAQNGNFITDFVVPIDAAGFASTESFGNLFGLTSGQPFTIRARTAQSVINSSATLNLRSASGSTAMGVLPLLKLDGSLMAPGRIFSIAMGNFQSARLLILSIAGSGANVDIFRGTDGPPGTGIYSIQYIPNNGFARIDLSQNEANSHLVVQAGSIVIVQLVIDDGKQIRSFMVPPTA